MQKWIRFCKFDEQKYVVMSVAEMKLAAISEIGKLDDEQSVKEILEHLAKLSSGQTDKTYNLSKHFDTVANKYGKVLEKLAQ